MYPYKGIILFLIFFMPYIIHPASCAVFFGDCPAAEIHNGFRRVSDCIASNIKPSKFFTDTLGATRDACMNLPRTLECATHVLDISCVTDEERHHLSKTIIAGVRSAANYLCEDNLKIAKDFIRNGGIACGADIIYNSGIGECVEKISQRTAAHVAFEKFLREVICEETKCLIQAINCNNEVDPIIKEVLNRLMVPYGCGELKSTSSMLSSSDSIVVMLSLACAFIIFRE